MVVRGIVIAALMCHAFTFEAFAAPVAGNSLEVASGLVTRRLDVRGGRAMSESFRSSDGTEFILKGSPEFAFRVDGKMYNGGTNWKNLDSSATSEADGSRTAHRGARLP